MTVKIRTEAAQFLLWEYFVSNFRYCVFAVKDTHNEDRDKSKDQPHLLKIWTIVAMNRSQARTPAKLRFFLQSTHGILCKISADIFAALPNRSELFLWLSAHIFQSCLQVCSVFTLLVSAEDKTTNTCALRGPDLPCVAGILHSCIYVLCGPPSPPQMFGIELAINSRL